MFCCGKTQKKNCCLICKSSGRGFGKDFILCDICLEKHLICHETVGDFETTVFNKSVLKIFNKKHGDLTGIL